LKKKNTYKNGYLEFDIDSSRIELEENLLHIEHILYINHINYMLIFMKFIGQLQPEIIKVNYKYIVKWTQTVYTLQTAHTIHINL
jgi:hypothetical protein